MTGGAHGLLACIDDLEGTNARMRQVFEARAGNWKLELVGLRRAQSTKLSALSGSLNLWSAETLDPGQREEIMRLFAEMRHAISVTQAEWPLSLINDDDALAAYTAASRRTIRASEAFFARIQALLQ